MNAAAIDLGTNSIKILIVRHDPDGHMRVLLRHRVIVRLGEGTFTDGKKKIPRHVQLRTLKVFQTYAKFLEAYKVDVVRATGTSALRDAKNGPDFIREVREKTGIALETLPAEEEARLIVKGVASEISLPPKPTIFIDIGGGSCEVSLVHKKKILKFVSLPLGAVRMTEMFLPSPKPKKTQLKKLDMHIKKLIRDNWREPPTIKQVYGSAGTIRALARVISKSEFTDDDHVIRKKQLDRLNIQISKMSKKRITALPGIDNKRAEILTAGTRVLKHVFDYFGIEQLKVSNRGLREGLLLDLLEHPKKNLGVVRETAEQERLEFFNTIGRRYQSNRSHCHQVWNMARLLFDELAPVHGLSSNLKPILMAASILHDIGRYIAVNSSHKHSLYILQNTVMPFFSDKERLLVANLARYHRKSPPRVGHEDFDKLDAPDKQSLFGLASILRLADALDAPHDQGVRWLKCQWGPGKVHISVDLKEGSRLNQVVIKDKAKLFEDHFKVIVTVSPLSMPKEVRFSTQEKAKI
ncbi:MAG: Ppx/GppA phosphatase family protein [Oligoflexia bacterium]|nr:Ppx/GppA phosphatase family protein [Oligoflexia bacterium]